MLSVAVVLWAAALPGVNPGAMNDWGLLRVLPIAFFAGLGLLVVSIAVALTDDRPSPARLGLHLAALVLVLHGTVPLVLSLPSYPWLYKHVGVVGYIDLHGALDTQIDIYHNWPGFFAVSTWFSKIAGVASPLVFAGWAPVYFNAIICLELAFIFRSLPVGPKTRWLGLFLFVPGNWVGQDYFAPQAMAMVLSLAVFGMAMAWLQADRPTVLAKAATRAVRWVLRARVGGRQPPDRAPSSPGRTRPAELVVLFAVFIVLVVTHQLTPYAVIIGLGLLAILGLIRPRWVVVALASLAIGYLLLRLPYLGRTQDLFSSLFEPWRNLNGNGFGQSRAQPGRRLTALGAPALMLGLWALAGLGVVRRVRAGRPTMVVAILAASPVLIALGQSYGGEAVFRIYLFSLPWSALLAATALERGLLGSRSRAGVTFALVLAVASALFMSAFYGSVELYRVRAGEVSVSRHFYAHAKPGSVLVLVAPRFPARVSANYDQFVSSDSAPSVLKLDKTFRNRTLGADDLSSLSRFVTQHTQAGGDAYLTLGIDQQVYAEVSGLSPPGALARLDRALAESRAWRLVCRNSDAALYVLSRDVADEDGSDCRVPPTPFVRSATPFEWASGMGIALLGLGLLGMARRGGRVMFKRRKVVPDETPIAIGVEELMRQAVMAPDERDPYRFALKAMECDTSRFAELVLSVDAPYRPTAIRLLAEAWGPLPAGVLQPLLADPWGSVRTAALEALDVSAENAEFLLGLLRNDLCADTRAAAVRALAHSPETEQVWALTEALADPDPLVRATAVLVLPIAGHNRALGLVMGASQDPNLKVREAAHSRLAAADSWALWMALEKSSHRDELCAVLEAHAPDRVAGLALERLTSPEPQERALAVELAGRARTPECIFEVIAALRDPDVGVRRCAAAQLGDCPQAVPALADALWDPDSLVRLEVARALDSVEHDDALAALVTGLHDPDPRVQGAAIDALARRSSPGLAHRVIGALTPSGVGSSLQVLKRMGSSGERALLAALEEGSPDHAPAVAGLFEEYGVTDRLLAALDSVDPEVRLRAVEALGQIGDPDALRGLVAACSDPSEAIRIRADRHLRRLADDRGVEDLQMRGVVDEPPEVTSASEASLIGL